MGIHVLDRLFLIKDTEEALGLLIGGVRKDILEQTSSLLNTSKQLISGIRTDIAEQTDSLLDTSKSLEAMDRCGLIRIYPTRIEASDDLRKDLTNPANSKVRLIGISLNDFVQGMDLTLKEAWETTQAYVRDERRIDDQKNGLDIRVLIIDPRCIGAKLRSKAESQSSSALADRLETDVHAAAKYLHKLEAEAAVKSQTTGVRFECRLYRLPPIVFLCLVDSICYVQQYHFWSARDNRTPIPVFKFRRLAASADAYPYHDEMENHFEWIWNNASIKVSDYLESAVVGTDEGVNQCGATNIYTDPDKARSRMVYLLKRAKKKVSIQGISLRSFFKPGELLEAILPLIEAAEVEIELLLLDPKSDQAKYRSYREQLFVSEDQSYLEYLKLGIHEDSQLYRDTRETIEYIKNKVRSIARQKGDNWAPKLEVGKYSSAPACFMLRVDDRILVEQYHYGKIVHQTGGILGKEMPLFEYCESPSHLYALESNPLRRPFGLLVNHFEYAIAQSEKVDLTGQNRENASPTTS